MNIEIFSDGKKSFQLNDEILAMPKNLNNILIHQKLNKNELGGRVNFKAEFQVENIQMIKRFIDIDFMFLKIRIVN